MGSYPYPCIICKSGSCQTRRVLDRLRVFSGEPENKELLKETFNIISDFPNVTVKFIDNKPGVEKTLAYYHNFSRSEATRLAKYDWILFTDTDEIMSDEFKEWFFANKDSNKAYNFACHWYFRKPIYRALEKESASVLIRKEDLKEWDLYSKLELKQFYQKIWDEGRFEHGNMEGIYFYKDRPNPATLSLSGNIMVHHFSWVRSKEEMLKKVNNWGHRDDKNWTELVNEEFSRPFNGTDFVHQYRYEVVDNIFNIKIG